MSNVPVPPALDRLAELLRLAEAKTRVQEIMAQLRKAAEPLRAAGDRLAAAERRHREVRPARLRELEQIEADDVRLKDLVRKTAQNRALLGQDEQREAEKLIDAARVEIEARLRAAQTEVSSIGRELDDARREVRGYLERYRGLRKEMDRLQPDCEPLFRDEDEVAGRAESYFPDYQIRALAKEIDDGAGHYGTLERREQYAQMMIWIGRLRRFQTAEPTEEERDQLEAIFRKLVTLSKTYEPGYIEAFHRQYQADWDVYIAEAQDRLRQATDDARRNESRRRDAGAEPRDPDRAHARRAAQAALEELRGVIAAHDLPDEGADEFRAALARAVATYGPLDGDLTDLVAPYRDLLSGPELRGLKRHLDQLADDEPRPRTGDGPYRELLAVTHGRKALILGGAVREESRRLLLRAFEFADLDWVPYDDDRPDPLDSLDGQIRASGVELVLVLVAHLGAEVAAKVVPLCRSLDVPCIPVEDGQGVAHVGEAIRRALAASPNA